MQWCDVGGELVQLCGDGSGAFIVPLLIAGVFAYYLFENFKHRDVKKAALATVGALAYLYFAWLFWTR